MNQRGFVLVEFVIALPLLIFLLYALGTLTFSTMKIAREQVADYVLETEAQEIIDRITADARTAHSVKIQNSAIMNPNFQNIFFMCETVTNEQSGESFDGEYIAYYKKILEPRIYAVHTANNLMNGKIYPHVYFKRQDDNYYSNPITGENSFGNTSVTQLNFSRDFLSQKILHITLEMQSTVTKQKVKFSTAVYMPNCEERIYHGEKIL